MPRVWDCSCAEAGDTGRVLDALLISLSSASWMAVALAVDVVVVVAVVVVMTLVFAVLVLVVGYCRMLLVGVAPTPTNVRSFNLSS